MDIDMDEPGMKKQCLETGFYVSKSAEAHQPVHRSEGRIYRSVDDLLEVMKRMGLGPKPRNQDCEFESNSSLESIANYQLQHLALVSKCGLLSWEQCGRHDSHV